MTTLLNRIQIVQADYEAAMSKFTEEFQALIVDKTVSLDERWATFIAAPAFLKEFDSYGIHLDLEDTFGEISWYDEFNMERGSSITADAILDRIEDMDREDAEEFAVAMKEELLAKRLGGFTHDW